MTVHLSANLYDELVAYSTASLPAEACGIMLGFKRGDRIYANEFVPMRNSAANPTNQFNINPIELLPYLQNSEKPLIGLFHSHPTAAPIPSDQDLLTHWHTIPTYWILSLQSPNQPELAVYELKKTITTTYHKLSLVRGQ